MSRTLARRERHDLCDLALELGPDEPTLCGEWTTRELLAHLFVREHRPVSAAGILVPPDGVVRTQLMEVFVRRSGRWWVEAYHNVDVKPRS